MRRKILSLGLVAIMILQLLTGCSLGRVQEGVGSNSAGEGVLQLAIQARGYGNEWLYKLAEAYQKKTGTETKVVKSVADGSVFQNSLKAGAKHNDVDIVFDIWYECMVAVATANYTQGYERAMLPLTDIYNKVPEGYGTDKTLKELMMPAALKAVTWGSKDGEYGDGNQYFASYMTAMEGLLYNVSLFDKYDLEEPKTTTEFFALMDKMKKIENGSYAKNDGGNIIYPYVYSGGGGYMEYMATAWWAQYDGLEVFNNVMQGKDANGNYSADCVKSEGKLSALTHASKLLAYDSGYSDSASSTQSFTNAQVKFLDNQAFMMSSGDWIEREMEGNFSGTELQIAFMRIPVNSDIVQKCDSVKTDAQLVEVISYIDGDTATKPSYVSDADLALIKEARSFYSSEASTHIAYIPVYSDMAEEAKDFLLFMYSKEGQEIVMNNSYGNMAPLQVAASEFNGFDKLSVLQKSKYEMIESSVGLTFVGRDYSHPMAYAGGMKLWTSAMEGSFGVIKTSKSYMTPMDKWLADYEKVLLTWDNTMKSAGVSN